MAKTKPSTRPKTAHKKTLFQVKPGSQQNLLIELPVNIAKHLRPSSASATD